MTAHQLALVFELIELKVLRATKPNWGRQQTRERIDAIKAELRASVEDK